MPLFLDMQKTIKTLLLILFLSLAISNTYKEPEYTLISKEKNIEIRRYSESIIAKTSLEGENRESNNKMFRVLANYIFGGNDKSQKIPMTSPVVTRENNESYDMIFFMLDVNTEEELPKPSSRNISIEKINLDTVVVIKFGWWTTKNNIKKHRDLIEQYIKNNNLEVISDMMVAQYNPPWTLPPFRRNELIFKIK